MDARRECDSTDEIEVTPAMIEAGVCELSLCESGDAWESVAEAIYRAMEIARRKGRLVVGALLEEK